MWLENRWFFFRCGSGTAMPEGTCNGVGADTAAAAAGGGGSGAA